MRKFANAVRWAGVLGLVASLGCKSLDVENPNEPDAARAFSDPGAVAGLITGGFKNWFNTHTEYNSSLLLNTMADGLTASWNNFNIRYYSSEGNECPVRCGWVNQPTSSFRFQIETFWYGYYGVLSNANDVLTAIRKNDVIIGDQAQTDRAEAAAVTLQGMVFAQIALNYDQGFIVTEDTDLSTPAAVQALQFSPRSEVRDAAIAKFDEAVGLWNASSLGPSTGWFGVVNGPQYSQSDMVKAIRTMQAELLAYYPRSAAENAQVNWGQVATYASQGLSSGGDLEFGIFQDAAGAFYDGVKGWGNDVTTMRADTRVARLITDGPEGEAKRHKDPWPNPTGNPQPNAFDARVGDGTWGPADNFNGVGTKEEDAGAGSYFAYAAATIFPAARGTYHYSNLGSVRYSYLAYPGYGLPSEDGTGFAPHYTATQNDLLWAEGLVRSGGNTTQAATLINKSRVGNGHLSALTGGEGQAALLTAINYENDIELLSLAAANYYNRRRIDGLKSMTPRQMPVPAKELQVLQRELYSFGGPDNPDASAGTDSQGRKIRNVREIWDEISANSRIQAKRRVRN
ncbi:MAG: hypothetical protein R2882_12575 [Gemmatimonadales bacterium]